MVATTFSRQSSFCTQPHACCSCPALPGQVHVFQESFVLLSLSCRGFYLVIGLEALGLSLESRVSARPVCQTLHVNVTVSNIVN